MGGEGEGVFGGQCVDRVYEYICGIAPSEESGSHSRWCVRSLRLVCGG